MTQPQELTLGNFVLDSDTASSVAWSCETMAAGSTRGNPIPLVERVRSMLTDGSLAKTVGFDNREVKFQLRLTAEGETAGEILAQAESALMAEVMADQIAPLRWTSPISGSWVGVFEVVTAFIDIGNEADWDFEEVARNARYYEIVLTCLPWVRDEDVTVIEALPAPADPDVPATVTSINDGTSATGWDDLMWPTAAWSSVAVTQSGSYVQVAGNLAGGGGDASISLVLTDSETMGATTYLQADVYPTVNPDGSPAEITAMFDASGTIYEPIAAMPSGTAGVTRYYFEGPASWSSVRIRRVVERPATGGTARSLRVYDLSKTDRIEISGANGFQVARTALVGGSAPTQAALTFGDEVSALIDSTGLIYTGTSPTVSLRALLATYAGTVTPDATKVSGATNDLSSPMVFLVPVEQLRAATFSLLALLDSTGSDSIDWSARVVDSAGGDIPGSEVVDSGTTLVTNTTSARMIHTIASIQMPVVAIEGSTTHCVEVTIEMASGGSGVVVDECWLLDTDNGAVTVINKPATFELTAIELRSPELDAPRPAVVGTWTTHGAQDISRLVTSFGTHLFWPGLIYVLTVADEGRFAPAELEYYRRHHTHPGPAPVASDTE